MVALFVPVILVSDFFFPYVTTRNIVFRACVLGALAFFIFSTDGRVRDVFRSDPIIKWLLAFLAVSAVSALLGESPWHSFAGDFERMGGITAWAALVLFYLLLRALMNNAWWNVFSAAVLSVGNASVLFAAGGSLPKSVTEFANAMASGGMTGNPGLLAPYLLFVVTFAIYLMLVAKGRHWRIFAALSALIALTGILFSANRSSELGLAAGFIVGGLMFLLMTPRKRYLLRVYAVTAVAVMTIAGGSVLLVQRRAPAVSHELLHKWTAMLISPVDQSRIVEWNIALKGFIDRPFLGYGPENYAVIRSVHFDPSVYGIDAGIPFDRAHNAWLELLATGGILSAATMVAVWFSAFVTIRRGAREKTLTIGEASLFSGALAAYAVYLTFWFFDLNAAMLWIALLALLAQRVYGGARSLDTLQPPRRLKWPILIAAEAAIGLALYWACIAPLSSASDLNSAVQQSGTVEDHLESFYKAMDSRAPQTFHTLGFYNAYLAALIPAIRSQTVPAGLRTEMTQAFARGFTEANRAIARDPMNDHVYAEKAKLEKSAGDLFSDPRYYGNAVQTMRIALAMSPRHAENRVIMADINLAAGDTASAVAQLDTAITTAPRYTIPYGRLARLELDLRDPETAAAVLARGLKNGYHDQTINYLALERELQRNRKPVPPLLQRQAKLDSTTLNRTSGNRLKNQL